MDTRTIAQIALDGLLAQRAQLDKQIEEVRTQLEAPPKRTLSPATRRAIAEGVRKRHAERAAGASEGQSA